LNLIKKKKIFLTNKSYFLKEADVYIICVPTPLGKNFAPDISFIDNAVKTIIKNFKKGSLVILESTCHPGCTRENVKKIFENNNYVLSKDVFISYSPERIDPGNKIFNLSNTTKVIGSDCNKSLFLSKSLYSQIIKKIFTLNSFDEAEMSKLIENVYRQVNIALINELAKMSEKLSINIWNTIKASSTKPYGFSTFFPGPGTGGHCIPLDPMYLFWRAKSKNFHSRFIKTANEINLGMPDYVVNRVLKILPKKINNIKILIIGIAYKKDIGDYREAPSLKIFEKLLCFGFKVSYHDSYINELNIKYKKKIKKFKSKKINKSNLENSDLIIVLANHSYINWKIIKKYSKKIFDTRNVFKKKDNKIILM
jgi:UDP-N-acetyl-D-glucosamine dehydrogenase